MGDFLENGFIKAKNIRRFDVIIILFIFGLSAFLIANYKQVNDFAIGDIEYYGLWALFAVTFLFEFFPQFISPDYSLIFSIALGINVYSAVIVTIIASSIGSWLAFIIGYNHGFRFVAQFFSEKKLTKMIGFWRKYGKWFVLASGTIPLPVPYIPLIFGALKMKKKDFILWGIIPRAIGFIATGIVAYFWMGWLIEII